MSTRARAIAWLKSSYPETNRKLCASKIYSEKESWTKSKVWWFEFSVSDVEDDLGGFTNLLCDQATGGSDFSLVKVSNRFLLDSKANLFTREKNGEYVFSIYLSANEHDRYTDQKGQGNIAFSAFVLE